MCWYSAITILLASWYNFSSVQLGYCLFNSLAILLCSLIHNVCITVKPWCSLALMSPVNKQQQQKINYVLLYFVEGHFLFDPVTSVSLAGTKDMYHFNSCAGPIWVYNHNPWLKLDFWWRSACFPEQGILDTHLF